MSVIKAKCNRARSLGPWSLGPRVLGSLRPWVLGPRVPGSSVYSLSLPRASTKNLALRSITVCSNRPSPLRRVCVCDITSTCRCLRSKFSIVMHGNITFVQTVAALDTRKISRLPRYLPCEPRSAFFSSVYSNPVHFLWHGTEQLAVQDEFIIGDRTSRVSCNI